MEMTIEYETPTWYTMDVARDALRKLPTNARITSIAQLNPTTWRITYDDDTEPTAGSR